MVYLLSLVWLLRVGGVLLLMLDVWFWLDVPVGSDADAIAYNFSGPIVVWQAAPLVRGLALPLLMLGTAEILRLTMKTNGNAR